jgi:hypothetical protein
MSLAAAPLLALWVALGFALGAAHFRALRLNVGLYLGRAPLWRGLALHAARLAIAAAAFWAAAREGGALALLALLAGFLLARLLVVPRRVRDDD